MGIGVFQSGTMKGFKVCRSWDEIMSGILVRDPVSEE
jgi:hypothetical protein